MITHFRTFSDRRYHLQPCSPCEYCMPIGYWFWSCCFGKRLQGGRISSCPTLQFSSVQFIYWVVLDSLRPPWTAAHQASLSIANSQSLLKFMSIELMMPSNYLILCHRLLFLPSIFPRIRVFSKESVLCIRWPKYWSYSISSSMNIQDWFHLELTVWSPCCPRDSQESFPTPQFESISSLANSSYYRKQSFSGSGVPGVYIRVEGASTNTPKLMSRLITVFLLV